MDKKIILTILVVILLVGGILLFNIFNKQCSPPVIAFDIVHPMVGQVLTFEATSEEEENILWDFGDGAPVTSGNKVEHIFSKAGSFSIVAKSGECSTPRTVIVNPKPEMKVVVPKIKISPDTIRVNERVTFRDETEGASRWQSMVNETSDSSTAESFST